MYQVHDRYLLVRGTKGEVVIDISSIKPSEQPITEFVKAVVAFNINFYDTFATSFSGFSHTSSTIDQSLVFLDQRPGSLSLAAL